MGATSPLLSAPRSPFVPLAGTWPTSVSRSVYQTSRRPSNPLSVKANRHPRLNVIPFHHLLKGLATHQPRFFSSIPPPSYFSSYRSARNATRFLIALNAVVFCAWQYAESTGNQSLLTTLRDHATVSLANDSAGRRWTLLTSAFSHQDFQHFIFNMFALQAFGSIMGIVPGVGALHVFGAALGAAMVGSRVWLTQQQQRQQQAGGWVQRRTEHVALGASGMTMGLGVVAASLVPRASVNLMLIPIPIPLWLVTVAYAVFDSYYLHAADGVGHAAHLGGACFGAVYYLLFLRKMGGIWPAAARMLQRR